MVQRPVLPTISKALLKNPSIIDWDACIEICNGDIKCALKMLDLLSEDLRKSKVTVEKHYKSLDHKALLAELERVLDGICYFKVPELDRAFRACYEVVGTVPENKKALDNTYHDLQKAIIHFLEAYDDKLA